MSYTDISEIVLHGEKLEGSRVKVAGWVRTARDSKTMAFIALNDGTCLKHLQLVINKAEFPEGALSPCLKNGVSLEAEGVVVPAVAAGGGHEVNVTSLSLIGDCPQDYPLQKKHHSLEFLRTIPHLRVRTNTFNAMLRVRSKVSFALHRFFQERGYTYIHTPIITGSDCEGAGAMFQVTTLDLDKIKGEVDYQKDFFGKKASLTVSGQLNVEPFAMAFSNVYTFGPTFRAERSNTTRHAAEFWMIEPEMSFCDLAGDMDVAEAMVKYVIDSVMEKCPDEIAFLNNFVDKGLIERLKNVSGNEFVRLTYTEAISILEKVKDKFEFPVYWGCDLQSEHERYLTEQVYKKPVFLTDYPKEIKAFYMRLNDDGKTVAAADLLVPGIGELIGGSQREEREDVLLSRMKELGLDPADYDFYIKLRRYGGTVHSGFGLGFERMIMYLTGISNIRDVLPYPRTVGNLEY